MWSSSFLSIFSCFALNIALKDGSHRTSEKTSLMLLPQLRRVSTGRNALSSRSLLLLLATTFDVSLASYRITCWCWSGGVGLRSVGWSIRDGAVWRCRSTVAQINRLALVFHFIANRELRWRVLLALDSWLVVRRRKPEDIWRTTTWRFQHLARNAWVLAQSNSEANRHFVMLAKWSH